MIETSAELVLLAIRSGITLGTQIRKIYVDNTKARALVLPLPNFFHSLSVADARDYFNGQGRSHVPKKGLLKDLMAKASAGNLNEGEKQELLLFFEEFYNLDQFKSNEQGTFEDGTSIETSSFNALISIRQWSRGADPNPSALQRVAGTLVELGVDYFVNVPGALNKESNWGKALGALLEGLDDIHFSEEKLQDLPMRFFVATVETAAENAELLSGDEKVQELIKVTAQSLASDVAERMASLKDNLTAQQRVLKWSELVFRSVLASAGKAVVENPKGFLGIKGDGTDALIQHVGSAVLGLVLDEEHLKMDRVFSRESLETVIKAALGAVAEHPEILQADNKGLEKLLTGIAGTLKDYDSLLTTDVLPELMRMILEKTGENLPLLCPDLKNRPESNLLLTAAQKTLEQLTKDGSKEKWKPRFNRENLLAVTEAVLDQVIENPGWLMDAAGKMDDNLQIALEAAVKVLRSKADNRLSVSTAAEILNASLRAVALRKEFLDRMPPGVAAAGQPLIEAALDAVIGTIFDKDLDKAAAWRLVGAEMVTGMVEIALEQLAGTELGPDKVEKLSDCLRAQITEITSGKPWDLEAFEKNLELTLS